MKWGAGTPTVGNFKIKFKKSLALYAGTFQTLNPQKAQERTLHTNKLCSYGLAHAHLNTIIVDISALLYKQNCKGHPAPPLVSGMYNTDSQ